MLTIQNLKQVFSTGLFFLVLSSSAVQANPIKNDNPQLKETDYPINLQISLAQKTNPQLDNDPALVGLWVSSDSHCSDDSCLASQRKMLILPDGTFHQGDSQLIGGDAGVGMSSSSDKVVSGEWKTANRIVYARANKDYQWIPVSRYYIQDGKMLLTFQDGSREVWRKSY